MFPAKVSEKLQSGEFNQTELGKYLLALDGEIDRLHKELVNQTELVNKLERSVAELEHRFGFRR